MYSGAISNIEGFKLIAKSEWLKKLVKWKLFPRNYNAKYFFLNLFRKYGC